MKKSRRFANFIFSLILAVSALLPQPLIAQTPSTTPTTTPTTTGGPAAPTGKTMEDYVAERGFYTPNGTYLVDRINEKREAFNMLRDLAVKYAPMAGADPVLVVWWAFVETVDVNSYTWNNCHNDWERTPDYLCEPETLPNGTVLSADDWQIAYGQQYNVAYEQLVNAFEAVYGSPNDSQKIQQVIQDVVSKAGISHNVPSNLTVERLQNNGHHGEADRLWALLLSRDPAMSVYLLSTALVNLTRDEAFGWGPYYEEHWQDYSNGLNDVLEAWGTAGTPGSTGSGSGFGPTEPPIELEVVDCPGVVREINAFNLPPSIYPKPNCGAGTPGAGVNGPTGVCTTDPNVQAYGTSQEAPPADAIFWTIVGGEVMPITQGFGPTGSGIDYSNYNYTLAVEGHPGVDVGMPIGTPLYTPVAGEVIRDGGSGSFWHDYGMEETPYTGELRILLSNGDEVIIGHMSQIDVRVGDMLTPGQQVGLSGYAPGPHLHLEYRLKQEHPAGTHIALDPRDVFGCANPQSSTDTPPPPPEGESGPTVQGIKTENGSVLQATNSVAPNFTQFQQKYGFSNPTGPSHVDFEAHRDNIAKLRDFAVKWAPKFNLEPEMVVMWSLAETAEPYDSWGYSHCHDMGGIIPPGETCINSNWQIGYGQQWSTHGGLDEAFIDIYGSDDPNKVQQVMQNSAKNAGLSNTAPTTTAASISSGQDRFWSMVLGRDQEISAYMVAKEIAGDAEYAESLGYPHLFAHACANWGAGYCPGDNYFQTLSNVMNDVLLNWGIAGSGITGEVCQVGVPTTTSSCSTMPDTLNGMETAEFVRKINQNMAAYKSIAECANVPWEMMAAIHLRETGLDENYTGPGSNGALGPWQIDPTGALWGTVDPYNFEETGCAVGKGELQAKAQSGPLGRPLRQDMDPAVKDDEYSIKDAFFAYNGRAGFEGNIPKGCTPALDGNPELNFDCSAYVMNNMDANHTDMCIGVGGGEEFCDGNDGTWKVYYKLHYSTFDGDGKLLVYGGRCDISNEVLDGFSAPTRAGKPITSQFWAPYPWDPNSAHEGIDIGNQPGDPVFAIADGEIIASDYSTAGGYYVILHIAARGEQPEMWVYYGHLDPDSVPHLHSDAMSVLAGQKIAETGEKDVLRPDGSWGSNGSTTAPHLHFDIRLTPGDPPDKAGHVNPCTLSIMVNTYPDLAC